MQTFSTDHRNKKLFLLILLVLVSMNGYSQTAVKWSTSGNTAAAGDFLGTTNNEDLVFKTNNTTAFKIKANGNLIFRSLEGSGDGLLKIDNSGKATHIPFTGDANQVLLGNGTFGSVSGTLWTNGSSGKIYYNGGKVGIGTSTPNFKLDVDGDVRIAQNLYLQGELVISDKIQTPKQMKARSIVVDSLLMDSTKAIYGVTNFKDDVKFGNKLSVDGSATIGGTLKLVGGLTFGTVPAVSIDPCIEMLMLNSTGSIVTVDAATDMAFDPETAPCGAPPIIPFTWQTWGNHVNHDNRWIGTIENFDFKIKTNSLLRMTVKKDGKVGIGTNAPTAKLNVEVNDKNDKVFVAATNTGTAIEENFVVYGDGHIFARDIKVNLDPVFSHPDYVFENNYILMPLNELDKYLSVNKHLPGVPSTKEVSENAGINLGEMSEKQLQKIEELTLYVIELNKKLQAQELKIQKLQTN